jgi:DNA-binding PadR family transcriptional regulator
MKIAHSTLEHAIMGVLSYKPASGYDVRKAFATNMRYYSDSPGSVYPALRRLESRGWVAREAQSGEENRGRQAFALTPVGRQELVAWLEQPVAEGDIAQRNSDLMLRFALMSGNVPQTVTLRFLRDMKAGFAARATAFRAKYDEASAKYPMNTGAISILAGVETMEAQARWADTALALLEEKPA